jgi:hypothetical protein
MAGELTRVAMRGQVRVSDEDRDRAVEALRSHYAAGRLSADELEERVERAYHSTTRGDVDRLFSDLPSDRGRRAAARLEQANRGAWRAHLTSYVAVNSGLVGLWGMTGGGEFWPVWCLAPWGVAVGWHGLAARAMSRRLRRPRELRGRGPGRPLPR